MEDKIDRFGLCPNCNKSWDGGDIVEVLSRLDCNSGKSIAEIKVIASNFGWFEHNKIHFSTLISHELEDGRNILECPNITCQHAFDRYTGEEFKSVINAKNNNPIIKSIKTSMLKDLENHVDLINKLHKDMLNELDKSIIHVTPENRQEIERNLQNKILPELPKINPNDIECPFDV